MPSEAECTSVASSLVREFLARRGMQQTLRSFDVERAAARVDAHARSGAGGALRAPRRYSAQGLWQRVGCADAQQQEQARDGQPGEASGSPSILETLLRRLGASPPPPAVSLQPAPPPAAPLSAAAAPPASSSTAALVPPRPPTASASAPAARGGGFWARLASEGPLAAPPAAATAAARRERFEACYSLSGLAAGSITVREPGEIAGQPFRLADLVGCTVALCDTCEAVQVDRLVDCRVLVGASCGAVFLRECRGCTFTVAR